MDKISGGIANSTQNQNVKGHPFQRLAETHTRSSLARKIETKVCQIPPDSLDLALASTYDHHAVWGAPRGFVLKQPRSCVIDHVVEYKKRSMQVKHSDMNGNGHKESKNAYRNDAYHFQLGIPPHHTSSSRRGYGRSPDGNFHST